MLIVVFIVLANTVLFKCATIEVTGEGKYSPEEIIERSGINIGDNLLHIKPAAARENILSSLAYVDDVQVKKSFPTKITINVTEAVRQFCITESGTTVAISRKGKIIEKCTAGELPIVKGYDPQTIEVGQWLSSKTEGKSDIPSMIFEAADAAKLKDITVVDMTDKFDVKITVEDRIILELGSIEDVQSKLLVAAELINNEIGKEEYVTLKLTNPEKVPVHNNSLPHKTPASTSTSTQTTSEPTVSEEPIEEPTDPEEPIEEPTDPEEPIEEPTDPEEPIDEPADPEEPIDEPTDPEEPIDEPTDPEE